ncbi:ABC-type enterobactin transport system, permease component [Clostridium aceticum]|uniref:ABC-type enterobactin transport system, permease component n=1 Tax=Clostridium aceticum TaxID=84022 RepID=A0A0D8IAI7_9CLOT|nr:iron chelate uptake ABC transporter family permease subunit [Clostridium aceticum]AKL96027.1 ABC-type enterobactin transport system, permease component [Clostridium aceticum]KJF27037.1 iron ABC transporter [Clostridium aceticum]
MMGDKLNIIRLGYRKRQIRWIVVTLILATITLSLCVTLLLLGNSKYSLEVVIRVLLGEEIQGASFAISTLRLPRMLAGLLVGIGFGMAGSTFQTILRNPLASPDIIGVTAGSSVGAMFCILVLKMSGTIVSVVSVISGLLVAVLIYLFSKVGGFSGGKLILIGIGIQAMLNAVVSFLLLKAPQYDVPAAYRWLSGSLNGIQMTNIPSLFIVLVIFGSVIILLGRHLKILELGEQSATTLGVRADLVRFLLVLSAVFLIAFATAVTGPISFVAFLAGPIATRVVGSGAPNEFPAGLVGAILVLGADLIGQFAFGTRFPVGVITGILGAPYLIILLIRMNRTGGSA